MKNRSGNQKGRGGARPGAGRKPKAVKAVKKIVAEQLLGSVDEQGLWRELLEADDLRVRLDALKYLTDRRDGKPAQTVEATGGFKVEFGEW